MTSAFWFIFGAVVGAVAIIVISCCAVESECDQEEERKRQTSDKNGHTLN